MKRRWKFLSLFAGSGGGSLGFTNAGWECVGAFDSDPEACRDHEYLTGHPAHARDLATIQPHELAALCTGRPDAVFTSPPCKGFSSCQPIARSRTAKYRAMNSLAERGVLLALEAWETPPALILLENVPRVQTRGREWLDRVQDMLRAYGYACAETRHDCGEWGHLAQHRERVLLVARHMEQVPHFLLEPPRRRVRGIGEVLMDLPVPLPDSDEGGPMHSLPQLAAINWVRLALIRAGKDWRDLPKEVQLNNGPNKQNGGHGVNEWERGSHAVLAGATVSSTWSSVQDPRVICSPRSTVYGVADTDEALGTVVAAARHDNGMFSIADPRVDCTRREGGHGVRRWEDASHPVIGDATIHNWPAAVADPRLNHTPFRGSLGVQDQDEPADTVRSSHVVRTAPASIADPRLGHTPGQTGKYGVQDSAAPGHTVIASARVDTGWAAVTDPRVRARRSGGYGVRGACDPSHTIVGATEHQNYAVAWGDPRWAIPTHLVARRIVHGEDFDMFSRFVVLGPDIDFEDKRPTHLIIRADDGTWHRPMTTLELAVLQGLPAWHKGDWLKLDGMAHGGWRTRIGNMVPPPTAEAIARAMADVLEEAAEGGKFRLVGAPIWVEEQRP